MNKKINQARKRKSRVRSRIKLINSNEKLRLSVFRSNKHIYAQIIDDKENVTLAESSTLDKEIEIKSKSKCNIRSAELIGLDIKNKFKKLSLDKKVVFDRGPYLFHGIVKTVADFYFKNN